MASTQDEDMYLFQSGLDQTPSAFVGQDFDAFLTSTAADSEEVNGTNEFLNPSDLAIKKEHDGKSPQPGNINYTRSPRGSDSSTSSVSSSQQHNRNLSEMSMRSSNTQPARPGAWGSGINGFSIPSHEQLFEDASMTGLDPDFETSNQQMASDFDFETAASTPSGFDNITTAPVRNPRVPQTFRHAANFTNQPQFFFAGSREASPLNAMLPAAQEQSPWNKHSPSSGLEETFNHITMNGDSPGNATFSPNLRFPSNGFTFDPESSNTPSTFTKDISSPPSTINSSDASPKLTVHPTSLKSRVETQIPIKLTLFPLPVGAKKLRLPKHTVSKPKFLAKPEVERSPEVLELYTSLVCTSAMQDPGRLDKAWARARGEEVVPYARPSPASSTTSQSSRDDEEKPLNGGEVRICSGCIQRERKRASRKKQKKPEEEELFQKDEEKRVIVFNTNEIKEWVEAPRDSPNGLARSPEAQSQGNTTGGLQVELPMRIACYCRHQNEKLGFQVIFTIKDYRERVIAQAMTNPIMITDDHKTHNPPPPVQNAPSNLHNAPQVPGAGVFSTSGNDRMNGHSNNSKVFKQSYSTTDLHGLQHNFNPNFPMASANNPFAIPSTTSNATSATLTPRNLSRPASPSGPSGPITKRRKQSGSGKLPSGLTMTRIETPQMSSGAATMPNTAVSSPFAPNMSSYTNAADRSFGMGPSRSGQYGTSPPTPNGHDSAYVATQINRSFSLENLPRQGMISAPASRQPSRPGSPTSAHNSIGAAEPNFGQAVTNQLIGQPSRRPPPLIHKLVPAEGSVTGGTEVTLLGNGFYQGLEVMFGDTEATTTTFWGEKCLNCIAPPALQPGVVAVVFKHEHPQYATSQPPSQTRTSVFTYVDDRELEMFRLALRTLGKQMQHPTDDPYSAAQQLIQTHSHPTWPSHGAYNMGGGHQRNAGIHIGPPTDTLELEATMMNLLEFLDLRSARNIHKLDLQRPSGLTLLHLASSLGLTRLVAGLLSRGANPNLTDKNGHTPMHHAAMNGHTHIIHRLRIVGANHKTRSLRNFTPADVATSLLAYQAAVIPAHHYRSRSAGGTPMRLHSRRGSSTSLKSFWENTSNEYESSDSDDSDLDHFERITGSNIPQMIDPTRSLGQVEILNPALSLPASRRGSAQHNLQPLNVLQSRNATDQTPGLAPSAFMLAWRDHLVAQLHQFNESAHSMMPNLANLNGQLQALQDYQAYPVVRRVSSLFPQRPSSRQTQGSEKSGPREGWWETLTGSWSPVQAAPPAYGELYPEDTDTSEDWSVKKSSALRAAADATVDMHYERQSMMENESKETKGSMYPGNRVHDSQPLPGSSRLYARAEPNVRTFHGDTRKQIQRIELSRDRKLFFFWIPVLAIVLALMIRNSGILQYFGQNAMTVGRIVEIGEAQIPANAY